MKISSFKDLNIWQDSQKLLIEIYRITKKFPRSEEFNLISQLRRSSLSIPTNIAESFGRFHFADSNHFLINSRGSAQEVRSLLYSAKELGYLDPEVYNELDQNYEKLIVSINALVKTTRNHKESNQ